MNFRGNIKTMLLYIKLLLILLFITPLSASIDNLSPEFKQYKNKYASGRTTKHDSNVAISYLVELTNQLTETLDSNAARDLERKIKRILGSGEGVGGLMRENPVNPSAHYANEQQTHMMLRSIITVEKLRKDSHVDLTDYTQTDYRARDDDEAKHAVALWAIAQGSQIARQHPEMIDIYSELSRHSSPSSVIDLETVKHYLKDLQTSFRRLRLKIAEIEDAKELFEKSALTEEGIRHIIKIHDDWEIFFDESLNPLKLPVFETVDGIDRLQIIRKLFESYQRRKIDFSVLIPNIEVAPTIEDIAASTLALKQYKDEKTVKIVASKLAKAVGKTVPVTAAETQTIKDAIIAIEQAREDERTLKLEDYLPAPGSSSTEAEKIHALRIWMIAFGTQRAIYNAERGDLDDVIQNLDLISSNPSAAFVRENWRLLNPQEVLGEGFVAEVNANIPNIVEVRRIQQLLRLHAQARKPLATGNVFLERLKKDQLFFDAKINPVEQSYLYDKPELAAMMLKSFIANTSERSRDFVTYRDLEGGSPATKLYYKNLGNGECGFFGLNKDRKSSSDEIVWNLDKPRVRQWVTAATLKYLEPGRNRGGEHKGFYLMRLKTQYGETFISAYDVWEKLIIERDENGKKRNAVIKELEVKRNELAKERSKNIAEIEAIGTEIDTMSKPYREHGVEINKQIDEQKAKMKEFLGQSETLQWIITNLFAPSEWIQFSGAGPDEEMLDFGDVIAFLNNLKVYTIAGYEGYSVQGISNRDKQNAKEIFLFNPSNGTHYDRLVDWDNWREQIRAERHERERVY